MAFNRELLEQYGMLALPALIMDDDEFVKGFAQAVTVARNLRAEVTAKPATDTETVKVDDSYVKACKADENAKLEAERFLRAMAIEALERFEDQPNVWYWLRETDTFSDSVRNEIEYARFVATRNEPKTENASQAERASKADDYREIVKFLATILDSRPDNDSLTWPPNTVEVKDGNLVPALESLRGNFGSADGFVATGRYAKTYMLAYAVQDMSDPDIDSPIPDELWDDEPRSVVRSIWTGVDRIGKSVSNLNALVMDDPKVWQAVTKGKTVRIAIPDANRFVTIRKREDETK